MTIETVMEYLTPETIEGAIGRAVAIITAIGVAIGRVRRAIGEAIRKATTKQPPE